MNSHLLPLIPRASISLDQACLSGSLWKPGVRQTPSDEPNSAPRDCDVVVREIPHSNMSSAVWASMAASRIQRSRYVATVEGVIWEPQKM